jgi:hypothetical protein
MVLGCLVATGRSAHGETHVLDGMLGVGQSSARDDLLIPLAFTGPAVGLGARYALAAGPHRAEAELQLGIGVLQTRFHQQAEQLSHGLAVGYRRELASGFELGGIVRWHDELSYLESWDDAHGYWLSQLVLGASARHVATLASRLVLETRAELALVGIAARPPGRRLNKQDALTHVSYHLDRLGDGTHAAWIGNLQSTRLESIVRLRSGTRPAGAGVGIGVFASFARDSAAVEPYTLLTAGVTCRWGWEL